ncbi:ubiquitin carboxyl-terminal hydrolase [Nitzschia inconspicua]|uniref:Ubiquitin carboxyl-terminal hydrolase n=1 Tax=Nitzschia inconspicua TaxID=303405 RepID=A0A9K3L2X3_9STRA|nr:ubiquitin carboxyl-terminal hydrolase [Nitzschia inconspicua]
MTPTTAALVTQKHADTNDALPRTSAEVSSHSPRQTLEQGQPETHESHKDGADAAISGAEPEPDWNIVHYSSENGGVSHRLPTSILGGPFPATTALNRDVVAGRDDPQWKQLWNAHKDQLVDPSDVHATLQDLMATFTNKLSETELLMLQRKVRSVVRKSNVSESNKRKARKSSSVGSNNINDGGLASQIFQDSSQHHPRSVVEKYHLLTPNVVKAVLPKPPSPLSNFQNHFSLTKSPSNESNKSLASLASATDAAGTGNAPPEIRTVETTYLLALYCSDALWDRVAEIAVQAANSNDLEMDVNKQTIQKQQQQQQSTSPHASTLPIPEPCDPTTERPVDPPPGVGLHALSFLVALALRGTRQQQLNLLFYLMLPPRILEKFLERHPAGGFPTWLLEVGQDCIVSLASLSHYYWYGGGSVDSPYLPSPEKQHTLDGDVKPRMPPAAWNKRQESLALTIPGREVVQLFMSILLPEVSSGYTDPASPNGGSTMNGNHNPLFPSSNSGNTNKNPPSPIKKNSTRPFKRRSSQNQNNNDATTPEEADFPQTEVMERLQQQEAAANNNTWTMDSLNALDDYCTESSRRRFAEVSAEWLKHHPNTIADMTIFDFDAFCREALDDGCITAIMYRLFAQGLIPSPTMELDLVKSMWREWQESSDALLEWSNALDQTADGAMEIMSQNIRKVLENGNGNDIDVEKIKSTKMRRPFGGLGGFDGRGGTGYGILYCVDKKWWDSWETYVGWSWAGDSASQGVDRVNDRGIPLDVKRKRTRPGELSTNNLLVRDDDAMVAGILGSYQLMRTDVKKDVDYVLVPSSVWDVLYELYAGGPPLPRMVLPPERSIRDTNTVTASEDGIEVSSSNGSPDIHSVPTELDLDAMASTDNADRVLRIPRLMEVETHPWVLHFHLCDPQQPYRKQELNGAGPITIRVMASPDQPLWRLFSEIVVRLPFHLYKPYGPNGQGRARLWKRSESGGPKTGYGPWPCVLLCKNRSAVLPNQDYEKELQENYDTLKMDWEAYADHATVESSGLVNGSQVLVEFGVFRNGEMVWPREAAAKAGMVRRLADKDRQFRRMLMGLDGHGKPLATPPELVGQSIDAMDPSGRWYEVHITQVKNVDPDTDEEDDDSLDDSRRVYKQVQVDFTRHGGHPEWIDVESDRLASLGRYTMGNQDEIVPPKLPPAVSATSENKNKSQIQVKKATPDTSESSLKVCTVPGYGACGLLNLGNTCYINSALQCISYFPMLRSYLLSGQYKATGDLNKDNPLGTEGRLLEEFVDLLRVMWSGKLGEKSPRSMRMLIAKLKPDVFAGADQQDAQELLSYVLDALMEDSNRVRKKPYVEGLEDDWVKNVPLHKVGEEAWRRERRRSRSIVTDVVTGQTLVTTTCPICNYKSQKFDIFNVLPVPLPTVADVFFKCLVVRRANAFNTPWVLNRPRNKKAGFRFRASRKPKPPSEQLLVEQYIVGVSRLADSNDLRQKIQSISGIPFQSLIVCSADERAATNIKDDGTVIRRRVFMEILNNIKKPCGQLVSRQRTLSEDLGTTQVNPGLIIAFESTLRSRPKEKETDSLFDASENCDEGIGQDNYPLVPSAKRAKELEMLVMKYGTGDECRLYDTETLPIAKAISRSIWPSVEEELKLGLRVDALDQKDNWCTGSVIEIIGNVPSSGESKEEVVDSKKVRIHFDNFSSKWDEYYTIQDFKNKRVQPLYSHSPARTKPTEFIVHHRYTDRVSRISHLFGQPFFVQCHSEWTTARAGAQILAQASRFLSQCANPDGPVDVDAASERESRVERLYERTQAVISELIDMLIDFDRELVLCSLGFKNDPGSNGEVTKFCNPKFDSSHMSSTLVKRINEKLHRLPFEVRVGFGTTDSQLTSTSEDVSYPFSLLRNIGNYMGARNCIVLQWREPPSDKKASPSPTTSQHSKHSNYLGAPVMYNPPKIVVDEESAEILNKVNQKAKNSASGGRGSAGLPLGVCLTEFCKVQKLGEGEEEETPWRCPRCKDFRPGANQKMVLWRLPDILTIALKRFRSSAKFREKITTKVNFPLTGLNMKEWCHLESQVFDDQTTGESYVYDLIAVLNHLGSIAGGHYIATCKATPCSKDGREEVAFDFNGYGTTAPDILEEEPESSPTWKFGRQKVEVNQNKVIAMATSKAVGESAEPLWLQFDDEYVEPIPPRDVVSETAYVLFYRRRRLTTANVARYSTLD